MIYFDNAATSWPKPENVLSAMEKCMREYGANPGRGGHKMALEAGRVIFKARESIAKLFNIKNPMNVIFTLNTTEALNLGIKGLLRPGDNVITTSMEHNSVIRPLKALEETGVEVTIVNCNQEGYLNPDDIKKAIKPNTRLIVITFASNVTGTVMPVEEVGKIAREKGIVFMVDAAQGAGIFDIDVEKMNIDLLAFPGHKALLGPQGTGGLFIREGINLKPLKEGGTGSSSEMITQPDIVPDKYESGTPNTVGIAGLSAGVEFILEKGIHNIRRKEEELTEYMLEGLKEIGNIKIYGPKSAKDRAAVISINIGEMDSGEVSYILDRVYGIATRAGLHCAGLAHRTIGSFNQGTVRFSFGYFNTKEEVDSALDALRNIASEV